LGHNADMTIHDLRKQFFGEGFTHTYVWEDGPGVFYADHTHATATAHIILDGEMTVTSQRKTETYKAGDRFDVPARTVHSARMGPQRCRYLIGRK
jgi:mannose-6-phosphate isomerase-like protein (cupin superfamily)